MRIDRRLWSSDACLIYKRCSKDEQDMSLVEQQRDIGSAMTELGLSRVLVNVEDDGKRGHDEKRPGLIGILQYVKTHPNRVRNNSDFIPILVYELSRFGRFDDPKKIFAYFVEIEAYGYEFYSVSERIRSRGNIADFVQAIIKSEQAYDFSVNLSKYGLRTGCSLASKGWSPGGSAPFGYDRLTFGPDEKPRYRYVTRPDKTVEKRTMDGKLVELLAPVMDRGRRRSAYSDKIKSDKVRLVPGDARAVKAVKIIFGKFVLEGWGLRRISAYLNAQSFQPPRGRCWLHTTVRSILLNPAYKGALVYGRRSDGKHHWLTIRKDQEGYSPIIERKDVPGRTFVHRTEEECIVVDGCHEPLVEPELWQRAHAKMKDRKHGRLKASGIGVKSSFILSGDGLIRCAHCGYRFQGDTERRTKKRRYVDGGYHMGGTSVCSDFHVPADALESWVLDRIQDRVGQLFPDRAQLETSIEHALMKGRETGPTADAGSELQQRLDERRKKVDLLVKNISPENLPLINGHLSQLRGEIEAIENELRAVRVASRATNIVTRDLKDLARKAAEYVTNLRDVLAHGTPEERKRFVRDFVGEIVVDGKKREVRASFYDFDGADVPLWLMPPTGFEPVLRT
jgi:DNA invertase Pin-like site-specific DNA recombinase/archaellum component FlaC